MKAKRLHLVWHLATEADHRRIKVTQFVLCAVAQSSGMLALAVAYADAVQSALGSAIGGILALGISSGVRLMKIGPLMIAALIAGAWFANAPTPMIMSVVLTLWGVSTLLRCQFVSQVASTFPPILVMSACALTKSEALLVSALSITSIMQALVAMAWSSHSNEVKPGVLAATKNLLIAGVVTVPIALACFLLFPRVPLGFNEATSEAAQGQTGLSDSMTPGSVAELVRNPKLAFTASFYVETLRPAEMYWRAAVFDVFDGKTWRSHPSRSTTSSPAGRAKNSGAPHYEVSLPPAMGVFIPLLENTSPGQVRLMSITGPAIPVHPNSVGIFENRAFAGSPVKIEAVFQQEKLPYSVKAPEHFDTQLPETGNSRTRQLASAWYQDSDGDTQKFIQRIRYEILMGPYRYTLRPNHWRGADGIDQFMFETKAGFCEHYASAFVFMLRSVGIPSRIVIGYQGGEIDRQEIRVLYRDAHAWTEVWHTGRGWLRVDPTTFIDPMKVEASTKEALERPNGWKLRLEAWTQKMSMTWNEVVVQYGEAQQQAILEKIFGASRYVGLFLCAAAVVMFCWWLAMRAAGSKALRDNPDHALVLAFQTVLCKLREAGEAVPDAQISPRELSKVLSDLAYHEVSLMNWIDGYERARYGSPESADRVLHAELVRWAHAWRPERR